MGVAGAKLGENLAKGAHMSAGTAGDDDGHEAAV
jgi:hypothetical protein